MNRIKEIMDEYSQLQELDKYDLSLEAVGDKGGRYGNTQKGQNNL